MEGSEGSMELSEPCPVCGMLFDYGDVDSMIAMTQHDHPEQPAEPAVDAAMARMGDLLRLARRLQRAETDEQRLAIVRELGLIDEG